MRTKRSIPMALMWLWCVVLLFECVCAYHVYIGNTHLFRYMFAWLSLSFPPLSTVIRFNVPKLVVRIVNFACVRALMYEPLSTLQLEYKYALKCDEYVAHSECIVESNWNLQRKLRAICQDKNANKHMPSVIWTTSVVSIFLVFFCVRDHWFYFIHFFHIYRPSLTFI